MREKRYSTFLTILLIVIIVGIVGLLGYLGYDYYKKYYTVKDATEFVDTFIEETDTNNVTTNNNTTDENTNIVDTPIESNNTNTSSSSSTTTKKQLYKGFEMVGTIEIPKTGCKYPILAKPTKKALETAVVVYYPLPDPVLNEPGNVVIAGHNYRNGTFFSNNKKLAKGDKIYITDLNKNKVTYIIYNIFEAADNDSSFYNRDTNGAREITLSTCTDDSKARLIIEAKAEGD